MRAPSMPPQMHHPSLGRRIILAALSIGSIWRGIAYLIPADSTSAPSTSSGAIEAWAGVAPWLAGALWVTIGIVGIVSLVLDRWLTATTVIGAALLVWGLGYAAGWLTPWVVGSPRDWISTGTYMSFATVALGSLLIREPVIKGD